jgi:hypothetical protein
VGAVGVAGDGRFVRATVQGFAGFKVSRFQKFQDNTKNKGNYNDKSNVNYPTSAKGRQKWGTLGIFLPTRCIFAARFATQLNSFTQHD